MRKDKRISRYIKFACKLYLLVFCIIAIDNIVLVIRYACNIDFPYFDEKAELNYKQYSLRVKTYRAVFCFYHLNQIEFSYSSTLKHQNGLYIGDALNGNYVRFTKLTENLLYKHLILLREEKDKDKCASDFYQAMNDKLEDGFIFIDF